MILKFSAVRKPGQTNLSYDNMKIGIKGVWHLQGDLYVSSEFDILLKANFTKSSQVNTIGT